MARHQPVVRCFNIPWLTIFVKATLFSALLAGNYSAA
jgi:hypothetical protein